MITDYQAWLKKILTEEFSPAELELHAWLSQNNTAREFLLRELKGFFNKDATTIHWFEQKISGDAKVEAGLIIYELRKFAGQTWNLVSEKPHYESILKVVHKRLAKQFKKPFPEVASVATREKAIAHMYLGEAINNLSASEIEEALKGTPIDASEESKKSLLFDFVAMGGLTGTVMKLMEQQLKKQVTQKATKAVVKKVATTISKKAAKRIVGVLGAALLIKDVIDLGGEATRVTTPMVAHISIFRTLERSQN